MHNDYIFTFSIINIIVGIVWIIVFVAYFHLCRNISQIKRKIAPKEEKFAFQFYLLLSLGMKEEAKQYLVDTMLSARTNRDYGTISQIEDVLNRYSASMEKVGLSVDIDFLNSLKNNV